MARSSLSTLTGVDGTIGRYDRTVDGLQEQVGDRTYAYYPLTMSRIEGMWAADMKPLAQIRPKHDWEMFDRLPW
jgi:hypothetical protein